MSVRKREWTTSAGEPRQAWVLNYRDREGQRRQETFERKKDADARAAEIASEIRAGTHVARRASISVAEAGENWIERATLDGRERGTIAQYRQHLDRHIAPLLGRVKLSDLSAPDVAQFELDLQKAGVSDAMRRKVLVSLSSLLREAVRRGHVNRNAAEGARVSGGKRGKRKLKVGKDIPTPAEISVFVTSLPDTWRPFFLTAVFTGMRLSELRGLRWENVDLKAGQIHVRERADAYHEIGRPKSQAGERTIPIGPMVVNTLREWKLRCPKSDLGLVFPTRSGAIQSASNIRKRALIPLMEKAGVVDNQGRVKYTGMHALRHFYASWCINSREAGGLGLLPKEVQDRMGHSTLAMTMDTYGHLFPRGDDSEQLRAAETALLG